MTSYVLDNAKEGYDERLSLFEPLPVETAIEDVYYKDFRPLGAVSKGSTLEFDVQNNSMDYIWLSDIYLLLTLKILDDKDKGITDANDVTFVNFPSASIFRQVDVAAQHQVITSSVGPNYPIKAMIDTLLYKGKNEHESTLKLSGFEKDTAGSLAEFIPSKATNAGLSNRYTKTSTGKPIKYKTKIYVDILQQKRLLIPGVPLNIKLFPSLDKFALMYKSPPSTATVSKSYTFEIVDATLVVPHVKINPGMLAAQGERLKKEMALYPFKRSEIKTYNIAEKTNSWSMDNLFQDCIPDRLVITTIDSLGYIGTNNKNPFHMQHFNLNYLDFQVDGRSSGSGVLQPDFGNKNFSDAYFRMMNSTPTNQKEPPNITPFDYINGYTIYVLDLFQSRSTAYTKPFRRGQTRLTLKFGAALPVGITVVVYGVFEALMKVDYAKNVIVEA